MGAPTITAPAESAVAGLDGAKLDRSACFRIDSRVMRTRQITRMLAVVGAAMGVLSTAAIASAQTAEGRGFGQKGEFIFSADRLVPILAFTQNKFTNNDANPNVSTTQTGSAISLLWGNNAILGGGPGGLNGGGGNPTFYTTPRVGFDYVLIPNLTLGGDLFVFFTLGGSSTTKSGNTSVTTNLPSGNAFGIAPRVGYIFGMSDLLSIWLRGGLSFYHAGTSQNDNNCNNQSVTSSANLFGLDLNPQLVISPVPHFAFTAGPALDFGVAGGASQSRPGGNCNTTITTSEGYSSYNIGITGGLLGWF